MTGIEHEASKLGVDPEWLAAKSTPIGVGRCPMCKPEVDIIREGGYIQPCLDHEGTREQIQSPDDGRVTARVIEIALSGDYV